MTKIAAIVVTYNADRNNWIQKCLVSLFDSDVAIDVIVVDNASKDNTCNIINSQFPDVTLISSEKNLGFGGANNIGLETALKKGCSHFFLLNQDAWVEKDTVQKLVTLQDKNPEYGILSPLHLSGDGKKLDFHFISSASYSKCPDLCSDFILGLNTDRIYETENVCAAAWMLSKKCLELVGGFSPSFFHYAEDNNYIHRLQFKGLKAGIYPKVKMYHDRDTRTKNNQYSNKEFDLNNIYLLKLLNPKETFTTSQLIKLLRKEALKSLLSRNVADFKMKNRQIENFKKKKNDINFNLSASKKGSYPFLNL